MFTKNKNKIRTLPREFSKKKNRNFFDRILYWLCFLAFAGGVVYVLFFSPWVVIAKINISGTEDLNEDEILQVVKDKISGKYLNVIEKSNYFLIKRERLGEILTENFKKIEKVRVDKKFPDQINISLVERKEVLVLCNNNQCFIVDSRGIAYSTIDLNNSEEINEHLLILKNEKGREVHLGDFVFEEEYAQYLLDIKYKLESDLGIKIEKEVLTPQLISGDLRVKTTEGWMIYFDKNIPIEKEVKMLDLVLKDKLKEIKREDIEYIDLRTDNKIYYKIKNKTIEENKTEEQSLESKEEKDKNNN